jgi:phage antirepressor YoqD-like protein/phage anti-repressor protein
MSNLSFSIQSQIKATVNSDQEYAVPFEDAWLWLEYSRKDAAKRILIANFEEGVDYCSLHNIVEREIGATRVEEIYLTKDCLKQLAMMSGTAKGKAVRLYFLECERELKASKDAQLEKSTDIVYLLEESAKAIKEARMLAAQAEAKVIEMAPKVETYNGVCEQGRNLKVGEVAKILSVENMGPNKLFAFLRDKEVLRFNNEPYAKYEFESKYFTCVRGVKNNHPFITPLVTPKGIEFIIRLLTKHGHYVPSKAALVASSLQLKGAA